MGPQTTAPGRLMLLDILRGVAIIGTFAVNVGIFAYGEPADLDLLRASWDASGFGWVHDAPSAVGYTMDLLANGKFYTLLSIMFGVGIAIQFESAMRKDLRWPGKYHWRSLFLFVEGTLHYIFVFQFDVLMGYAVTAIVVAWLLTRSNRLQTIALWASGIIHLGVITFLTFRPFSSQRWPDSDDLARLDGTRSLTDEELRGREGTILERLRAADDPGLFEFGYWDGVAFRVQDFLGGRWEPIMAFGMTLFLFLLGVKLYRAGVFDDTSHARRIRNHLMIWGLGAGIPATIALQYTDWGSMYNRYVTGGVVALGYIGLTGFIADRVRRPGPLSIGLASLGRCAMSGYVLQNVLGLVLCSSFALNLNRLGAPELLGTWWPHVFWAGVCLFLMVGSWLWLHRFDHGPLETVQKVVLARIPDRPRRKPNPEPDPAPESASV